MNQENVGKLENTLFQEVKGTLIGTGLGIGTRVLLGADNISKIYQSISNFLPKNSEVQQFFQTLSGIAEFVAQNSMIEELSNPETFYLMSQLYTTLPIVGTGFLVGLTYDAFRNSERKK